jgi:hypothetical protein
MNKMCNKIAVIGILVGTMMAASSLFATVHAAPTTAVQGKGTGSFHCGNGVDTVQGDFSIFVNKEKGKLGGQWTLFTPDFSSISGTIYGGKIGKTTFTLLSIEGPPNGPQYSLSWLEPNQKYFFTFIFLQY